MSDAETRAKLRAIAAFYNGGQVDPNILKQGMGQPDNSGRISVAPPMPSKPVQNVPAWAMHDTSAPEGQSGAGTIDDMAAIRAKQLQLNNLASQPPQPEPDLSGYQNYQPRQFNQIQQRLQPAAPPPNIRDTLSGPQELTPELEKQLGYGSQDDEDDDEGKNLKGSSRETGTRGGV